MGKRLLQQLKRIGDEAKLLVIHDDSRIVDALFITSAPVRGFEKLVLGKNPLFVLEAVMRICGICHAAHAIAAAEAFENAVGIAPPADGRRLREAIGLINRVQSHVFHLILILPDLIKPEILDSYLARCIKLLNMVNDVMMRIGGAPTHPPNITIGGVIKPPTEAGLRESLRRIREIQEVFSQLLEGILSNTTEKVEFLRKHTLPSDIECIASHLFYGDRYGIDFKKISVIRYEEYKNTSIEELHQTTSMIALYDKRVVEMGPRARLVLFRDLADRSLLALQMARFMEIDLALQRVAELLECVRLTVPVRSMVMVYEHGRGVGVYEAPREHLFTMSS